MTEKYNAIWHGYTVTFCTENAEIELRVNSGCRGWFPVTVQQTLLGEWVVLERPEISIQDVNYL